MNQIATVLKIRVHWLIVGLIAAVSATAFLHQHNPSRASAGVNTAQQQVDPTITPSDLLW